MAILYHILLKLKCIFVFKLQVWCYAKIGNLLGESATTALIKGFRTLEHICDVIGDRYEEALK